MGGFLILKMEQLERRLISEGERKLKVVHEERLKLSELFPGQSLLPPEQQHPRFRTLNSAFHFQELRIRMDYSLPVNFSENGNGKVDPQELI